MVRLLHPIPRLRDEGRCAVHEIRVGRAQHRLRRHGRVAANFREDHVGGGELREDLRAGAEIVDIRKVHHERDEPTEVGRQCVSRLGDLTQRPLEIVEWEVAHDHLVRMQQPVRALLVVFIGPLEPVRSIAKGRDGARSDCPGCTFTPGVEALHDPGDHHAEERNQRYKESKPEHPIADDGDIHRQQAGHHGQRGGAPIVCGRHGCEDRRDRRHPREQAEELNGVSLGRQLHDRCSASFQFEQHLGGDGRRQNRVIVRHAPRVVRREHDHSRADDAPNEDGPPLGRRQEQER